MTHFCSIYGYRDAFQALGEEQVCEATLVFLLKTQSLTDIVNLQLDETFKPLNFENTLRHIICRSFFGFTFA